MNLLKFLLLFFSTLLLFSCSKNLNDDTVFTYNDKIVNIEDFDFFQTSTFDDFYFKGVITDSLYVIDNFMADDEGIILIEYGDSAYYNPVTIAQTAFKFLNSFTITHDSVYLDLAKLYAQKLIDISIEDSDAILFPYGFNFPLHRYYEVLEADWYSGMSQGQALSLFSKLFVLTNDSVYFDYAQKTYNSFYLEINNNSDPWVGVVDSNNYLWIEEYPTLDPNYTLNGFLFAIVGVYDWCKISPKNNNFDMLSALVTTAKYNIERFRVVGDLSVYCLKHQVQSSGYHRIHKEQIDWLYLVTNDEKFLELSTLFSIDN